MIVCCPGCQKRYDISVQIKDQKESYKLRCMHCGTQWRISRPAKKLAQTPSPLSSDLRKIPPLPKVYSHWHDFVKRYSLDWILILGASTLAILVMIYEGHGLPSWLHFPFAAQSSVRIRSELKIENVEFSTVEQNGHLKLVVRGEIVNQASEEVLCPDIDIVVWGECAAKEADTNEAAESTLPKSPERCRLLPWIHQMLEQPLQPGERRSFESISPVQIEGANIKEVEVTWYSPQP